MTEKQNDSPDSEKESGESSMHTENNSHLIGEQYKLLSKDFKGPNRKFNTKSSLRR